MPDIRILLVIAMAVIGFPLFVVLFLGHFFSIEKKLGLSPSRQSALREW